MRRTNSTHRIHRIAVAFAMTLMLATAGTVQAGDHHDGHGALHAAVAGLFVYSAIRHAGHHGAGHYGYAGRHHSPRHHARHGGHHDRHGGYYRERDCRTVYKHGYHHGRRARIAGTQCYDRHGNPYIVRGSRYVVEYY